MRIAIVTSAHFQLLELARELLALGHHVRVYSDLGPECVQAAGFPEPSHRSLLGPSPFLGFMRRRGPDSWQRFVEPMLQRRADRAAARQLAPCDALIGTVDVCVRTFQRARDKFGAVLFLDCPAHHVMSRKNTLEAMPNARRPAISHFDLKRALWGYGCADVVVAPTWQAARSYVERGVNPAKIFRNFPGADLDVFLPTARPNLEVPTILYVGPWSIRKGCDLLAHAVAGQRWRLIHIGPVGDAPVPDLARFEQRGSRPDSEMRHIYRAAHLLVYPSFDDCVGEPQICGVASGLPLVCSDCTGGEDLREFLEGPDWVTVVPVGDVLALTEGLKRGVELAQGQTGVRAILRTARAQLSWRAHGERYDAELRRRVSGKG